MMMATKQPREWRDEPSWLAKLVVINLLHVLAVFLFCYLAIMVLVHPHETLRVKNKEIRSALGRLIPGDDLPGDNPIVHGVGPAKEGMQ